MKRILIVMTALMLFAIIGCTAPPEPWEQMNELESPMLIENVTKSDSLLDAFDGLDLYVTHSIVMNDNETLYYAPLIIRKNGQIWLNDDLEEPVYFIRNTADNTCIIVNKATLKEIFRE